MMLRLGIAFAVVLFGAQVLEAETSTCNVFRSCDRETCVDVPGHFRQRFKWPSGGVGKTGAIDTTAYLVARKSDVIDTLRRGDVPVRTWMILYPDDEGLGSIDGVWLDAFVMAVQALTWSDEGKPTLHREVALMACFE